MSLQAFAEKYGMLLGFFALSLTFFALHLHDIVVGMRSELQCSSITTHVLRGQKQLSADVEIETSSSPPWYLALITHSCQPGGPLTG